MCISKNGAFTSYKMNVDGLHYRYWIEDDILAIEDLGGILTVTACLEQVLGQITHQEGSLAGKCVIYADSQGIWDAVTQLDELITIHPLGGYSYLEACQILSDRISEYGLTLFQIYNCPSEI